MRPWIQTFITLILLSENPLLNALQFVPRTFFKIVFFREFHPSIFATDQYHIWQTTKKNKKNALNIVLCHLTGEHHITANQFMNIYVECYDNWLLLDFSVLAQITWEYWNKQIDDFFSDFPPWLLYAYIMNIFIN